MSVGQGADEPSADRIDGVVREELARADDAERGLVAASLIGRLDAARRLAVESLGPGPESIGQSERNAPSIRDVAAAAGVSYQTVSRVINNSSQVRPVTRDAVLGAIARLGFRPNRAARSLGRGRARNITVVASNTVLYGYASTIQGVARAARDRGLGVAIRVVESMADSDLEDTAGYLADPDSGYVVVVGFDRVGRAVLASLPAEVPAVAATDPGSAVGPGRTGISLQEEPAAAEATRHLLDLGHATVHHIAVPSERSDAGRQAGWRGALAERGLEPPDVIRSSWDAASGMRAAAALAGDPTVTALLCGNDDVAAGALRALAQAGRRVPQDVSLVGFDDIPMAEVSTPALTTVHMDFVALGRACVEMVTGNVPGPLPEPRLVVRESTSPPRSR